MGARVYGRRVAHLQGVEHAEDVQLSFLRHVGGVGEEREGYMHGGNIDWRLVVVYVS